MTYQDFVVYFKRQNIFTLQVIFFLGDNNRCNDTRHTNKTIAGGGEVDSYFSKGYFLEYSQAVTYPATHQA